MSLPYSGRISLPPHASDQLRDTQLVLIEELVRLQLAVDRLCNGTAFGLQLGAQFGLAQGFADNEAAIVAPGPACGDPATACAPEAAYHARRLVPGTRRRRSQSAAGAVEVLP